MPGARINDYTTSGILFTYWFWPQVSGHRHGLRFWRRASSDSASTRSPLLVAAGISDSHNLLRHLGLKINSYARINFIVSNQSFITLLASFFFLSHQATSTENRCIISFSTANLQLLSFLRSSHVYSASLHRRSARRLIEFLQGFSMESIEILSTKLSYTRRPSAHTSANSLSWVCGQRAGSTGPRNSIPNWSAHLNRRLYSSGFIIVDVEFRGTMRLGYWYVMVVLCCDEGRKHRVPRTEISLSIQLVLMQQAI